MPGSMRCQSRWLLAYQTLLSAYACPMRRRSPVLTRTRSSGARPSFRVTMSGPGTEIASAT
eukprot:542542-Rhodomonas_salina.2